MALLLGVQVACAVDDLLPRARFVNVTGVAANRTVPTWSVEPPRLLSSSDKVLQRMTPKSWTSPQVLGFVGVFICMTAAVIFMFQPQATGTSSLRLPPRWEPGLESSLPFRVWMQDLMLWTIGTDLQPHQQCAAIIQQLGGAARELARNLSPAEVYHGGIVNGVQLDPVSYLLHGLSARFGPLDEESRLRATQDLLSFSRRQGETVDTLISRFELVRSRARNEGGGVLSVETAALILLRACGVSSDQFQTLTQPFGLRLPNNDAEFAQMGHHLRRMGHIVERFPNNIASGLRGSTGQAQAFLAEADTGSSRSADGWQGESAPTSGTWGAAPDTTDWAFHADPSADSDTDSATSSDNDEPMQTTDLQGMSAPQMDEYLFGQYQAAKKRWRRFTGKPVRSLRRVLKRKGKGKGKGFRGNYLNLDGLLQQSSYFKGKGKGGKSSGKGFGRKTNPCGRDGEPLKCSVCGSAYHLRAKCPRSTSSENPSSSTQAAAGSQGPRTTFVVEPTSSLHFATVDDGSWDNITTPRSHVSVAPNVSAPQAMRDPSTQQVHTEARAPEVHELSPDPWTVDPDPWTQWLSENAASAPPPATQVPMTWDFPGMGSASVREPFSQVVGLTREPPASDAQTASGPPPFPMWLYETHQAVHLAQANAGWNRRHSDPEPERASVPSIFAQPGASNVLTGYSAASFMPGQLSFGHVAAPVHEAPRVAEATVSVFSQVHALRASASGNQNASRASAAAPETAAASTARPERPFQGRAVSCTVCLEDFAPGDHVGRLTCGHTFHCMCIGELAMHNPSAEEEVLSVECPNCRQQVTLDHAWHYPRVLATPPEASESDVQPAADQRDEAGTVTPRASRESTSEFRSPESQGAYPWWPVPSLDATSGSVASGVQGSSYHTSVQLASGRVGLLIDPGSYGNLVGEEWLADAVTRMGRDPMLESRAQPLQVGGVGRGAQMCSRIAITRDDGSTASGTFSSPVVSSSGCPALLGLRSLQENRAILDMSRNVLHFAAPGEITIKLPPGSETYQLEVARSGHLLLPCDAFKPSGEGRSAGEHHLFADGVNDTADITQPPKLEAQESFAQSALPDATADAEEQACADVLAQYSWEAAVALILCLTGGWSAHTAAQDGRFCEHQGVSISFGAFVYGGRVGISQATGQRPQLAKLLCRMITEKEPQATFTAIQILRDVESPVHTDKYNAGLNVLLPLKLPRSGGNLWQELREGDCVSSAIQIRSHGEQQIAGVTIPLREGHSTVLDPKRRHATQPWKQGTRLVLAAFTAGSYHKLPMSDCAILETLGFPVPLQAQPCTAAPVTTIEPRPSPQAQAHQVVATTRATQDPHQQPPGLPRSATVNVTMQQEPPQRGGPCTQVRRSTLSFVKRVLLITLYHSTFTAFLDQGWEPTRLRPLELLRDNFDDVLFRLKSDEYHALWIDLAEPKHFAGHNRMNQVCARLGVLLQWAERLEVPIVFSACRRNAWQHTAVETLLRKRHFHISYHNWCAYGVKVAPGVEASAVKHKMLSSVLLPSAECACPRGTEHTYDLDINRGPGASRVRAEAEHRVISHVVSSLSEFACRNRSGPAKLPDPLCTAPSSGQESLTYACECCGLLQATEFCSYCEGACAAQPGRTQSVKANIGVMPSQPTPEAEPGNPSQAFPTEQKLRVQERRKQGLTTIVRKKAKTVQQHFDDCGDSLASLDMSPQQPQRVTYLSTCFSDEDDDDAYDDYVVSLLMPQLNSLELHSLKGELSPFLFSAEAVDVDEMICILSEEQFASWGPEVFEVCGDTAESARVCARRRVAAGRNFDIVCSTNLRQGPAQEKILAYIADAKPFVVVMTPASAVHAQIAEFCGRIAALQQSHMRFFLCEHPFPSAVCEQQPWPAIRASPECCRVVLHQCQLGHAVNGVPVLKPTEMVANAKQLLLPFANLQCPGQHLHASTSSYAVTQADVWPPEMCKRVAVGIEALVAHLSCAQPQLLEACLGRALTQLHQAFPSVQVGTDEGAGEEAPTSEPWRKCKGCLWRLEKHDPLHSRVRGICKHPDVEEFKFECPGCKARKHRSDPTHTFGPDCRHVCTQERRSVRRRPYARVPAVREPTADLKASSLGHEDGPRDEADEPHDAVPQDDEPRELSEPASGSRDGARPVRGPDHGPRHMRTRQEASAQTPVPADWSSFDVQASFRSLRQSDEAGRRRILRKLHLRWFHIGTDKMQKLLKCAGLGKDVLDLVPSIVDTCRVCQHWARPGTESKTSGRMVLGFNIEVEGDLMFCRLNGQQHIVMVLVDRGVRWTCTSVVESKTTPCLLNALDTAWIAVFGPMGVLVWDGETGLDDDESTTFFQLRGITKRTAAPNQHTRIADRKIAVLRDTVHKLNTQLVGDGVNVPFVRVVAEATFALNALTSVNGMSPYTAVLGRVPAMLPCDDTLLSDRTGSEPSKHSFRLRELAVQAIAEGTARERMKRALHSQAKPSASADLDYRVGEVVDYWREPVNKDVSGWRGPATIVDLTRLEHGRIGIRTNTDQVLTCRVQDIRRSLVYLTVPLCCFFSFPDSIESPSHSADQAQMYVQAFVDRLTPGTVITLGQVKTAEGQWVVTPQTAQHRAVHDAAMFIAETVFQLTNVACVRVAKAVRALTARSEFNNSMLLWWSSDGSRQISFLHSEASKLAMPNVIGQNWTDARLVQMLCLPDEEGWVTARRWSEPAPAADAEPVGGEPPESVHERLSTIPEGSNESGPSLVSWIQLCDTFGDAITEEDREHLTEAYLASACEEAPQGGHLCISGESVPDLKSWIQSTDACEAEIPAWADAFNPEQTQHFLNEEFSEVLSSCNCDADDYTALDADDTGVFVAIEVYGSECKCLEGLPRQPMADEHAELRFYEAHTRKVVIERSDDLLTQEEIRLHASEVTQAIIDELKTWQGFKCFKRRPRAEAPCVIDVRWVFKWKFVKEVRKIRARLCLRGFKESGSDDQSNYSATATRFSQRALVSECVLRGWVLASSDVPKAFLQGVSYDELAQATNRPKRDVSFDLTGEALHCLRQMPEFKGFDPRHEVLHCLKPGTGCRDAPKCFSLKLRNATSEYGFVSSTVDPELELLFKAGELLMAILKHVDDLKMVGPKGEIIKFVDYLSGIFGKLDIEFHKFTFCGVAHEQHDDGSVSLDQTKFLAACKPMIAPKLAPTEELPEDIRRHFLSLLMTIAYSLITRPDIAVFVTALQRESHKALYVHVTRINTLLKWAQANPRKITYPVMRDYPDALVQISDSSYRAKAEDGLSVRGLVSVRACLKDIDAGCKQTECHMIDFVSKAQRHVTRSTFSAELFAATDATDSGLLHTIVLHELKHGVLSSDDARLMIEGSKPCSVHLCLVVDAKSVSSATTAPNLRIPAEPSLLLHVNWVRSLLMRGRLHRLFWCDTRVMIADAMTKGAVTRALVTAAMRGVLEMSIPYSRQEIV